MKGDEFASALGGKIGGHVLEDGHWDCTDCLVQGREATYRSAALALYRHRRQAHSSRDG